MHPIIKECIYRGISVNLNDDGYWIDGFYKSGIITLKEENGKLIAYSRYGRVDEISGFGDLVSLQFYWWVDSKDRWCDGYYPPHYQWEQILIEYGYIKKKVKEVVEYEIA